jgi:hypothetical protein
MTDNRKRRGGREERLFRKYEYKIGSGDEFLSAEQLKKQLLNDYKSSRMAESGEDQQEASQPVEPEEAGYRYRPGDEFLSVGQFAVRKEKDEKGIEIAKENERKRVEREESEKEFEEKMAPSKQDIMEKGVILAREEAKNLKKWKKFKELLGINRKAEKDEAVENAEKEFDDTLWEYVMAGRENLPQGNKDVARAFLKYTFLGAEVDLRSIKADVAAEMKKESGAWSDKYSELYKKHKDWWKGLSFKKKMAYSGAVFAIGATGAGASFASIGAMTLTAKIGTRILGAGVMHDSSMKWQEALDVDEAEYMVNQKINEILEKSDWEERIRKLTKDEVFGVIKERRETFESYDLLNKRRALVMAVTLPILSTAMDVYRWSSGGAGTGTGKGTGAELPSETTGLPEMSKGPVPNMEPHAHGIKTNITTASTELPESSKGISGNLPKEDVPRSAGGAVPVISETVPVPKTLELGSDTIGENGGLWKSTEKLIRANPEKFNLDRKSGSFVGDVRRLTRELLENHAKEHGMSYEELNEIASRRVQNGDILKIIEDPSTGKPHVYYSRDEIFGQGGISNPDVSTESGTPKGQFIQEKTKILNEEYEKHKGGGTSASSIHEAGRGGGRMGKIPNMEEIEADYQKDLADRKYARAVRAGQELRDLQARGASYFNNPALRVVQEASYQDSVKLDNIRSLIQNRGFFTHLFGVNYLDWDKLASDYTMGHEGQIPVFSENQTWDDLQGIKFREEMVKALRKKIGPEGRLSLKEWLGRISNQEFKLLETSVRNRVYK